MRKFKIGDKVRVKKDICNILDDADRKNLDNVGSIVGMMRSFDTNRLISNDYVYDVKLSNSLTVSAYALDLEHYINLEAITLHNWLSAK